MYAPVVLRLARMRRAAGVGHIESICWATSLLLRDFAASRRRRA